MYLRSSIETVTPLPSALLGLCVHQVDFENSIKIRIHSTVHHFNDGKMVMESKFQSAYRVKDGEPMHMSDGCPLTMRGDESAELSRHFNRTPAVVTSKLRRFAD